MVRKVKRVELRHSAKFCRIRSNRGRVMQQRVYGTKICDIYDLQKCMMQTWVDFEQNVIEAAIDQWRDNLRSCMRAGGGHFEHLLRNYCLVVLCGSSENYETVNVTWCM